MIINFLLTGVVSFCILYTLYVIMMEIKNNYDYESFPKRYKYPLLFIFALGYIGDVLWNVIYGSLLFLQAPLRDRDQTLTKRLNYICRNDNGWRKVVACKFCKHMLNTHDKGHCCE